jgi:hypothetical protein
MWLEPLYCCGVETMGLKRSKHYRNLNFAVIGKVKKKQQNPEPGPWGV